MIRHITQPKQRCSLQPILSTKIAQRNTNHQTSLDHKLSDGGVNQDEYQIENFRNTDERRQSLENSKESSLPIDSKSKPQFFMDKKSLFSLQNGDTTSKNLQSTQPVMASNPTSVLKLNLEKLQQKESDVFVHPFNLNEYQKEAFLNGKIHQDESQFEQMRSSIDLNE